MHYEKIGITMGSRSFKIMKPTGMEITKVFNHCYFPVSIGPTKEALKDAGLEIDPNSEKFVLWLYADIYFSNPTNRTVPIEIIQLDSRIVEIHIGKRPTTNEKKT